MVVLFPNISAFSLYSFLSCCFPLSLPPLPPPLSVELSSLSLCMTNSKLGEPCFYVIGRTENTRLVMVPVSSPIFCLSTCLYLVFTSHSFLFIVEMIILVLLVEVVVVICFIHSRPRCILNKAQVTFYVSSGWTDFIAEYIEVIHICNICQFGIDTSRGHSCSSVIKQHLVHHLF